MINRFLDQLIRKTRVNDRKYRFIDSIKRSQSIASTICSRRLIFLGRNQSIGKEGREAGLLRGSLQSYRLRICPFRRDCVHSFLFWWCPIDYSLIDTYEDKPLGTCAHMNTFLVKLAPFLACSMKYCHSSPVIYVLKHRSKFLMESTQ